jgi:type IV fimbrial biogenesis protein FimT
VSGTAASLRFEASGTVDNSAVITLCHKDKVVKYARALIVSLQGRVKISRDDNDDGLHEDDAGDVLTCS